MLYPFDWSVLDLRTWGLIAGVLAVAWSPIIWFLSRLVIAGAPWVYCIAIGGYLVVSGLFGT